METCSVQISRHKPGTIRVFIVLLFRQTDEDSCHLSKYRPGRTQLNHRELLSYEAGGDLIVRGQAGM